MHVIRHTFYPIGGLKTMLKKMGFCFTICPQEYIEVPLENETLVRIYHACLNDFDWKNSIAPSIVLKMFNGNFSDSLASMINAGCIAISTNHLGHLVLCFDCPEAVIAFMNERFGCYLTSWKTEKKVINYPYYEHEVIMNNRWGVWELPDGSHKELK